MYIKLYHGTSKVKIEEMLKNGTKKIYLTSDSDQAEYYAECAAEDDDSESVIAIVEVNINMLKADLPSFDEPLTFILDFNDLSEDEWHKAIESGDIPYPKINDWKTSLKYAQTALAVGDIKPSQIFIGEADLSEEDLLKIESAIKNKEKNKVKP
jgi:hypothetical protein